MQTTSIRGGRKLQDNVAAYSLVAPTTVLFTVFYFAPLILTIVNSFYNFSLVSPHKQSVGLGNYKY
ncbi:MAG: hypothetical protein ACYCOU_17135, partial [Sulfobacillus sp.]